MKFQKGNRSAKGGPRPNSGRPKNWFKKKCDDLLYDGALFNLLGRIADGSASTEAVDKEGKRIKLSPGWTERIRAITELRDTAHGRPSQHVDVTNDQALMDLLSTISLIIKQKVRRACPHCRKDLDIRETLAREFAEVGAKFAAKSNAPVVVGDAT